MPIPFEITYLSETESTNRYLRLLPTNEQHNIRVAVADFQTAGRGQRGNHWEAERGKNLLFSLELYPEKFLASRQFELSEVFSIAVREVLKEYIEDVTIKWPNDIYYLDRKLAGILIEHDLSGAYIHRTIIGLGLNVNQQTFCSDAPNPVSLKQITEQELDCHWLLQQILSRFYSLYHQLVSSTFNAFHSQYIASLYHREGFHRYRRGQEDFEARIEGIEPSGRLILLDIKGNERRFAFKEVAYL
ncbi:MAG: biotin--[acetyl-CoA-carboxylase] ligase [Bacteroidaceae bacterium]